MEALSEGRGEGRGEEAGAEDCGGGGGVGMGARESFNFILSPCLHQPCRLSSLIFTHRKREG